jgi:GTP-binding protein
LGINFLKHIEKVKVLLHCISCETSNALKDYETIRIELSQYNNELSKKPEVIVLTKTDLVDTSEVKKITKELKKTHRKIISVSIHDYKSLENLKRLLRNESLS